MKGKIGLVWVVYFFFLLLVEWIRMLVCMKINVYKKKMYLEEIMRKLCVNLIYFFGLLFKIILIYNCKVMFYSIG